MTSRRDFLLTASGLAAAGLGLPSLAADKMAINKDTDVFLIIDVQNCFMPGGTLPVPDGNNIVGLVNTIAGGFKNVVMTQDWHPSGHISFASTHKKEVFSTMEMIYGTQVMWPDHCRPRHQRRCATQRAERPPRATHHPQRLQRQCRRLFRIPRSRWQNPHGAGRLLTRARHQARVLGGTGDGFLRHVVGDGRAQARLRNGGNRRCLSPHRCRRVARGGVEENGRRRR